MLCISTEAEDGEGVISNFGLDKSQYHKKTEFNNLITYPCKRYNESMKNAGIFEEKKSITLFYG